MYTTTSLDGTLLAHDRTGDGPPLILVGGAFSTRTHPAMTGPADQLAKRFSVYGYDRRGRGDSGDVAPYAVEREIEDLQAVIDAAGGSASVYGLSSGAVLALRAAAAGLPIARLLLHEPPYAGPGLPAGFAAHLEELVSAGLRGEAVEFFMTRGMGMPAEAVGSMRGTPVWPELETLAHTLVYDTAVMGDGALPVTMAGTITVPTLVICGGDSPEWMRDAGSALANAIPGATYSSLPGQSHFAPDPAGVAEVIADYCEV